MGGPGLLDTRLFKVKLHRADYAPDAIFEKLEVNQRINDVEDVINNFEKEPRMTRHAFAAYILFKGRAG